MPHRASLEDAAEGKGPGRATTPDLAGGTHIPESELPVRHARMGAFSFSFSFFAFFLPKLTSLSPSVVPSLLSRHFIPSHSRREHRSPSLRPERRQRASFSFPLLTSLRLTPLFTQSMNGLPDNWTTAGDDRAI
jgi:hypothetical protein